MNVPSFLYGKLLLQYIENQLPEYQHSGKQRVCDVMIAHPIPCNLFPASTGFSVIAVRIDGQSSPGKKLSPDFDIFRSEQLYKILHYDVFDLSFRSASHLNENLVHVMRLWYIYENKNRQRAIYLARAVTCRADETAKVRTFVLSFGQASCFCKSRACFLLHGAEGELWIVLNMRLRECALRTSILQFICRDIWRSRERRT